MTTPSTLHIAVGPTLGTAINSAIGSVVGSSAGALVDPLTVVAALLLAVLGVAATVVLGVTRRRATRRDTAGGVWWEITPPGRTSPGSAVALWQLLGGLLRRHPGPWWWPSRLVLETVATADGLRIGLWLPPALRTAAPDQTLMAALPGARITPAPGPLWPAAGVSAVELVPRGGIWAPVLDPTVTTLLAQATRSPDSHQAGEREPLRLLYALLAARTPGDQAVVQVVVRAHHGTRDRAHGAAQGGGGVGRGVLDGLARTLLLCANGVALLVTLLGRELLELLTAPTAAHSAGPRDGRRSQLRTGARAGGDAVAVAHRAARDTKRANGPHLRVTLRLGLATRSGGPTGAAARRRRLRQLVGGFDLVTTPLNSRTRHRHPGRLLADRPLGAWFTVTTTELAGLWHLPAEPVRYRLPTATARDRPPVPDLLDRTPTRDRGHHQRPDHPSSDGDQCRFRPASPARQGADPP